MRLPMPRRIIPSALFALSLLFAAVLPALAAPANVRPIAVAAGEAGVLSCDGDQLFLERQDAMHVAYSCAQIVLPAVPPTSTLPPTSTIAPSATPVPPTATGTASPTATRAPPTATATPTATPQPTAVPASIPLTVQQAWFYNTPSDGTPASVIAGAIDIAIVTSGGYRDQLRSAGYTESILRYRLGAEVQGSGVYKDSSATCSTTTKLLGNQVATSATDFCTNIHPNEDWFLHNSKGERLYLMWFAGAPTYAMNPASPGWRAFALERLQQQRVGYDGILLDNIELDIYKLRRQYVNSDGVVKEFSSNDAFRSAMAGYLQSLAPLRQNGGQLWANLINDPLTGSSWNLYLPHLDGALQEAFATSAPSAAAWERMLQQVEAALRQGKGAILVPHGPAADLQLQQFALGSYLLVADGQRAYFRYSPDADYDEWLQYPNYRLALGPAKGSRYRLADGRWRRDFAAGYVVVDPSGRAAQIVQP